MPNGLGKLQQRLADVRGVGLHEQRVIEPAAHIRDVDVRAIRAQLGTCRGDGLAVLLAARVRMLGGGNESDRAAHAGGAHLATCVGQERMPVAHADVHRQRVARGHEP